MWVAGVEKATKLRHASRAVGTAPQSFDNNRRRVMLPAGRRKPDILVPMSKRRPNKASLVPHDALFNMKQRKAVPHEFVLDALASLSPETRPMFGCLAVYVRDKIVFALRDRRDKTADNGVWLATTKEHHASLCRELPNLRSIRALGKTVTGWQVLPADAPDFEESALRACELVLAGDPRIGKVPAGRRAASRRG